MISGCVMEGFPDQSIFIKFQGVFRTHVHATVPVFLARLRLQNLHFQICTGESVRVISREFGGEVAADQNIGTLMGLQHGLLLEKTHL